MMDREEGPDLQGQCMCRCVGAHGLMPLPRSCQRAAMLASVSESACERGRKGDKKLAYDVPPR
jgi:hypothetical protein